MLTLLMRLTPRRHALAPSASLRGVDPERKLLRASASGVKIIVSDCLLNSSAHMSLRISTNTLTVTLISSMRFDQGRRLTMLDT